MKKKQDIEMFKLHVVDLEAYLINTNKRILKVRNVSFDFKKVNMIIGPTGSGKSLFLKFFLGTGIEPNIKYYFTIKVFYKSTIRGRTVRKYISFYNDYRRFSNFMLSAGVSYIPQFPGQALDNEMFIGQQIMSYLSSKNKNIPATQLIYYSYKILELMNFKNCDEMWYKYPYELSGGMQQRMCIIPVLWNDNSIILADEPTSALDEYNKKQVAELMLAKSNEKNTLFIWVTHFIPFIKMLQFNVNLHIMNNGKLNKIENVKDFFDSYASFTNYDKYSNFTERSIKNEFTFWYFFDENLNSSSNIEIDLECKEDEMLIE